MHECVGVRIKITLSVTILPPIYIGGKCGGHATSHLHVICRPNNRNSVLLCPYVCVCVCVCVCCV